MPATAAPCRADRHPAPEPDSFILGAFGRSLPARESDRHNRANDASTRSASSRPTPTRRTEPLQAGADAACHPAIASRPRHDRSRGGLAHIRSKPSPRGAAQGKNHPSGFPGPTALGARSHLRVARRGFAPVLAAHNMHTQVCGWYRALPVRILRFPLYIKVLAKISRQGGRHQNPRFCLVLQGLGLLPTT